MSTTKLLRLAGLAAIIAGTLRIVSSFVPATKPPTTLLELFYLVIDVMLLFAILGVYLFQHDDVGNLGFLGFVLALVGDAVIVGPDGTLGGVDTYVAGSMMISAGLVLLGFGSWSAAKIPRIVPILWIISFVIGVGGFLAGLQWTLIIAGITFGLSFVLAGRRIWLHSDGRF